MHERIQSGLDKTQFGRILHDKVIRSSIYEKNQYQSAIIAIISANENTREIVTFRLLPPVLILRCGDDERVCLKFFYDIIGLFLILFLF